MTLLGFLTVRNLKTELVHAVHKRVPLCFSISTAFFLTFMFLDFYITSLESGGDWTMEGNVIAQQLWIVLGPFRVVELFIWPPVAIALTGIIFSKFKFLGLFWLNLLTLNHFFGFMTWLPYDLNVFVTFIQQCTFRYPIGFMSIVLSIPLSVLLFSSCKRN